MANGESKNIVEAVLKGGAMFALCCLLLVGMYGVITALLPNLRLTDAQYLERTVEAFESLSTATDQLVHQSREQVQALQSIQQTNQQILTQSKANHDTLQKSLEVRPAEVLKRVMEDHERIEKKLDGKVP